MKQMEVTIMGQSYVLACPPGGEGALHAAVRRVDEEMAAIRDSGKVKARERIAVLAALNLAYASSPSEAPTSTPATASPSPAAPERADAGGGIDPAPKGSETPSEPDPALAAGIEALIRRIDDRLGDDTRAT